MLMLNWPSWEERRKGGEGRIEDGRPSQAKNAIAPVVGAGRPLCLDGTGSGDTQDEPRDHWHLLADRLVARARREVLGPTGHRLPIPRPGLGYPGAFSGCQPFLLPPSPLHPFSREPCTSLPGPCASLPRLDPWPFLFFSAPPRAPPCQERAEIPSPVSIPHPQPQPGLRTSPDLCSEELGVAAHFSGGPLPPRMRPGGEPEEMDVKLPPFLHKHLFFLFLNPIGREHKNVHLKHRIPPFPKRISWRRKRRFS